MATTCLWSVALAGLIAMVVLQYSAVTAMYGCLCMIEHPQQKYCKAEFVITGRMVNMEWILIPQLMPTEEPEMETTPQPQYHLEDRVRWEGFNDGTKGRRVAPLPLSDDPLGGTARVDSSRPPRTQIPHHVSRGNPSAREEVMREPRNYNVIYEIQVDHIYKGSERLPMREGENVRILAPPPQRSFPMCSYSAMRMKRLYLFVVQNSDMMGACDWVEEYRGLTPKQKAGLKGAYGRTCDICKINLSQSGTSQFNPDFNNNATCLAEMDETMLTFPDYMSSDCYAMHSHCLHKKRKCKWYSSKDFKKCKRSSMREDAGTLQEPA